MTTFSPIILVLGLSNFCGAVIKGVTGFGSAIISIFVWGLANAAGINAGTLQQAVVSECVTSMVLALPLLWSARVWATCDWRLTLSLLLCTAAAAPVGAGLLKHLQPRAVEGAMAVVLLLVICLHCKVAARMRQWCLVRRTACSEAAEVQLLVCVQPPEACTSSSSSSSSSSGGGGRPQPGTLAGTGTAGAAVMHAGSSCNNSVKLPCGSRGGPGSPFVEVVSDAAGSCDDGHDSEQQQLLPAAASAQQCAPARHNDKSQDLAGSCSCAAAPCSEEAVDAAGRRPWLLLLCGAAAGCASGVMGGMTGMGGPPLMLLYEKLRVQKETVRGCNAMLNVLQLRVVAYYLTGLFSQEDAPLYAAVAAAGLLGGGLGHHLAGRMDQQTFSKVLVVLMVMCCGLLFASAAGLLGKQ